MDPHAFFTLIRANLFGDWMHETQVSGVNAILGEWDRRKLTDDRWLAYILATVYWETGKAFEPISETGGPTYLKSKKYYPWYGRGYVQLTWEANYAKFGIHNPDDALSVPVALRVLFDGMIDGMFTGKKLSQFFSADKDDPVGAREIVNGQDRAQEIAGFHHQFLAALRVPAAEKPVPPPPIVAAPIPTPTPKIGFWGRLWGLLVVRNS